MGFGGETGGKRKAAKTAKGGSRSGPLAADSFAAEKNIIRE
jgi:hypothetical protein